MPASLERRSAAALWRCCGGPRYPWIALPGSLGGCRAGAGQAEPYMAHDTMAISPAFFPLFIIPPTGFKIFDHLVNFIDFFFLRIFPKNFWQGSSINVASPGSMAPIPGATYGSPGPGAARWGGQATAQRFSGITSPRAARAQRLRRRPETP